MGAVEASSLTPVRFCSYGGDCRHIIGEVKGPNTLGEWLTAVSAEYDPEAETTRVGFVYGRREVSA